jgi:hypothetical protein
MVGRAKDAKAPVIVIKKKYLRVQRAWQTGNDIIRRAKGKRKTSLKSNHTGLCRRMPRRSGSVGCQVVCPSFRPEYALTPAASQG